MQYPYRQTNIPDVNRDKGQMAPFSQISQPAVQNGILNTNASREFDRALLNDPAMLQKYLMLKQNALKTLSQKECESCSMNLEEHIRYIDALEKAEVLDAATAQSIKESMRKKFMRDSDLCKSPLFEDDFLKSRSCLGRYLSESGVELDAKELEKVKAVVEQLEKEAVSRHQKQQTPAASGNPENETAKMRLMTGSVKYKKSIPGVGKLFTREEIAKMSSDEFSKNESIINYQLENGLL